MDLWTGLIEREGGGGRGLAGAFDPNSAIQKLRNGVQWS